MIYFIGNDSLTEPEIYRKSSTEECLNYFKDHSVIAVDTETQGRDPHTKKIISLQIGDSENQFVIDCRVINILHFKELLESKLCLFHNSKFDYKFLKATGIIVEYIYDTMLAECVIYCGYEGIGYSLKDTLKRYLNIDLDKSTRGDFYKLGDQEFNEKQIQYAALDVTYLHKVKEYQEKLINKYNLGYCLNLENQVVKALADIEYNGIYLNSERWFQTALEADKRIISIQSTLDTIVLNDPVLKLVFKPNGSLNLFGELERQLSINYASPKQILNICNLLGDFPESTNERELKKLEKKHLFYKTLLEYREISKQISTYGKGFLNYINKATGRVHTDFWQVKNTGRVSSGSKDMNAPNMQNIPGDNKLRNCFEARPGFLWVSIDYSGQELRIMADKSGEKGFIEVLNKGDDLHCYAGSMMFKKPVSKSDKELRNKAKTINFGKPYGMGPPKLADTLSISLDEANKLFEEYANAFPTLNNWLKEQGRIAKKQMYSTTFAPCLRRRWYPEMKVAYKLREEIKKLDKLGVGRETKKPLWRQCLKIEGQVERNGGNQPIQGTGADITKEALIKIRELIQEYNYKFKEVVAYLICTVHDAIDVEVREDIVYEFTEKMKDIMIKCGNKYVTKVNMEVDVTITKEWTK